MRIFASSDLHIDFPDNRKWFAELSKWDYQEDIIIVAGDLTDNLGLLQSSLSELAQKFFKVLFVPGNHELWVVRDKFSSSIEKFQEIIRVANNCGASTDVYTQNAISIVPLFSWYDYSFGIPGEKLKDAWSDFYACKWPDHMSMQNVAEYFAQKNEGRLECSNDLVISFSHFLPRIDLMPRFIPSRHRYLYPVLGGQILGDQVSLLNPDIHVYGHSHVNQLITIDGTKFINNAHGYPSEKRLSRKRLICIREG